MSDTETKAPQQTSNAPLVAAQDAWVAKFTGVDARRTGITIGGHRAAPQTEPEPPKPTWQSAEPNKDAPRMAQPRDLKLAEIDQAIKTLEEAANDIGAPLGRAAVEPAIVTAKEGREALASAADRGAIATQLAAAPALLEGIETARLAAVKDKADCATLAEKTRIAGEALVELGKAADGIGAPVGRAGVQDGIDKLAQEHAGLGKAATRDALAKEIETAEALPGKCTELGKTIEAEKKIVADWEAEKEKVRLAMEKLETAANDIGAPLARTAIDEDIKPLASNVEALTTAATREAVIQQTNAAPALVVAIGEAEKLAVKDKADCEALAKQQGDVKVAVEKLELAAKAIPAPLARTAIDEDIKPLTPKIAAVNDAKTRDTIKTAVSDAPGLVVEIGTVETLAAKDKADCEALALKTQETADALLKVGIAYGKITGKLAKDSVDPAIKLVTDAQADLAKAADRAEIDKQVKAAPQLLLDIEAAEQAAVQAEVDWQKLVKQKATLEKTLGTAEILIGWVSAGTAKGDMEKEHAKLTKSLSDLGTAATLKDYRDGLNTAKSPVDTLYAQASTGAAPEYSSKLLEKLAKWPPVFKKIADPNPVKVEFDALTQRNTNADSATDPTKERFAIGNAASAGADKAKQAYALDLAIVLSLNNARANINSVSDPTSKSTLQGEIGTTENERLAAYSAASIDDLLVELDNVKFGADQVRVAVGGSAKITKAIQASLKEADTAIKLLPSGVSPRTELETDYADLAKRLSDVGKIAKYWDKQVEYNAIDKEALALVEQARKAFFETEAATDEGKKRIDELIKQMGEGTDDPVKQAVVRAAIAARFEVPLEIPEGLSVTSLPTIYQMLAMVGEQHLKGLEALEFDTDPTTTASYYGSNKIVLNNMRDPTKEEDYKDQSDPDKKVRVKSTKTTALHELGHHVDEIKDVMGKNMEKAGFGKWKSETIDSVVTAVYTASFASFVGKGTGKTPTEQDLKALVRSLLTTGKAKKPSNDTDTLGSLFAEWANIEGKTGWTVCLAIRDPDGNSPWDHPVEVSAGRAYHEGYDDDWYSYDVGERAAGISDYQWRSPVEWFAEQFAFYRLQPQRQKPKAIAAYLQM